MNAGPNATRHKTYYPMPGWATTRNRVQRETRVTRIAVIAALVFTLICLGSGPA